MRHLCGGGAWPDNEPARQATHQHTRPHWCGGRRRAWPRCRWAAAGPGRAIHSDLAPLVWRAPEGPAAVLVGSGWAWPGTPEPQAPPVWRAPEGTEGTGGLRGAAPNEVRTPSLAGGRALRRPQHPWGHKQPGPAGQHVRRPQRPWGHKQTSNNQRQTATRSVL